ncbi:hypothetical protein [Nocardia abscessus]|uniref:hypothetical protein n=1 Tax=Nocardia abscessus TaxID=120957 RepID=UPI002456CD72|nr:hypothetical protein [Nocardia abscessus]
MLKSRLSRVVVTAVTAIGLAGASLAMGAAPAQARNPLDVGDIPEYYDFCREHPPNPHGSVLGFQSVYKTAIAKPEGVTCQHYHGYEGWFVPKVWETYYSWDQVCRMRGLGQHGRLDSRGIPHCSK